MRLLSKVKRGSMLRVLETHWVYAKSRGSGGIDGERLEKGSPLIFLEVSKDYDERFKCVSPLGIMWVNSEHVMLVMT
jgi:hypothetical protein